MTSKSMIWSKSSKRYRQKYIFFRARIYASRMTSFRSKSMIWSKSSKRNRQINHFFQGEDLRQQNDKQVNDLEQKLKEVPAEIYFFQGEDLRQQNDKLQKQVNDLEQKLKEESADKPFFSGGGLTPAE